MNELKDNKNVFENIKHTDKHGNEYWFARELMPLLEYTNWRNFEIVIKKARIACINSNNIVTYHFDEIIKMIKIAKGAIREVKNIIFLDMVVIL